MDAVRKEPGWHRFWASGGFGRAALVAFVYIAAFLAISRLIDATLGHMVDPDLFSSATSILIALALPVAIGSGLLLGFAASLGRLPALFRTTRPTGSVWMWAAPLIVALAAVLRIAGTDHAEYGPAVVSATYLAGLFIGLSEELLTRGLAVDLLRRGGYGERSVMLLSSLLFALLHSSNLLTGQPLLTVLVTMGFTFIFGVAMYLTLRVTGSLIWPILLHAVTDPSTFLASGGIDTASADANPLVTLAGLGVFGLAALALAAVILVRDRSTERAGS